LKLKCDDLLSNAAFKFKLRHYTAAQTAAVNAAAAGEGSLVIGRGSTGGGAVDDLRVWSRALSPTEVAAAAADRALASTG